MARFCLLTVTNAVECDAHDFTVSSDRFTGIDIKGTENSSPTWRWSLENNCKMWKSNGIIQFATKIRGEFHSD